MERSYTYYGTVFRRIRILNTALRNSYIHRLSIMLSRGIDYEKCKIDDDEITTIHMHQFHISPCAHMHMTRHAASSWGRGPSFDARTAVALQYLLTGRMRPYYLRAPKGILCSSASTLCSHGPILLVRISIGATARHGSPSRLMRCRPACRECGCEVRAAQRALDAQRREPHQ